MRHELKVFRVMQNLTQDEMAAKTGVSRTTYNLIENGSRRGSQAFWLTLQETFKLEDGQVWNLQKNII